MVDYHDIHGYDNASFDLLSTRMCSPEQECLPSAVFASLTGPD